MNYDEELEYRENSRNFSHNPNAPYPRQGMVAETVYADYWRDFAKGTRENGNGEALPNIVRLFNKLPFYLEQKHATLAASFICWLGTNAGLGFIGRCKRFSENINNPEEAYLSAWAVDNRRIYGHNSNTRTIEWLKADESALVRGMDGFLCFSQSPEVNLEDQDIIETLICWLSDTEGQRFVKACEKEIERRREESRAEKIKACVEGLGEIQ